MAALYGKYLLAWIMEIGYGYLCIYTPLVEE